MIVEKKKSYQKPDLFFESFALSQNIAAACEGEALFVENACPVIIHLGSLEITIFGQSPMCEFIPPNPDDFICYHAPSEMNNVFAS